MRRITLLLLVLSTLMLAGCPFFTRDGDHDEAAPAEEEAEAAPEPQAAPEGEH